MSKDLGDFQTPPSLVEQILNCPELSAKTWERMLEPTCGQGNFIRGLCNRANPPTDIQAIEIQEHYVEQVRSLVGPITIHQQNIFNLHMGTDIHWRNTGTLLVLGNPPWVTNAQLTLSNSQNHPTKTNLKGLQGFDAMTGSSNFDIAEHILLKLIWELMDTEPTIAMLCKTSVARNVLHFAPQANLPIAFSAIRQIDSKKWFNAAVDACLFYLEIKPGQYNPVTIVYSDLQATQPLQTIEHKHGQLISDVTAYNQLAFLEGQSTMTWRQGMKHDAAPIMELTQNADGHWHNKEGQIVNIETQYIYPLLKSSDLAHETLDKPRKGVIVTQHRLADDTYKLETTSPLLWKYLTDHNATFTKRKSSIYANKPPYSIFGIGDYSFSPYKVAIAGMYKTPRFQLITPINSRPVMCDDTCYFIACWSAEQAALIAALLNSRPCLDFISATIFKDSKRPITKKLLQRINLQNLLSHITPEHAQQNATTILARFTQAQPPITPKWPASLEDLLHEPTTELEPQIQLGLWSTSIDTSAT